MTDTLFPVEIHRKPEPVEPNKYHYLILGYWPKGKYWKVWPQLWRDTEEREFKRFIETNQRSGWTNIHVLKLPELP